MSDIAVEAPDPPEYAFLSTGENGKMLTRYTELLWEAIHRQDDELGAFAAAALTYYSFRQGRKYERDHGDDS